nr:MAG TPA: hypothetical protein [Caudoviricetes sp.]
MNDLKFYIGIESNNTLLNDGYYYDINTGEFKEFTSVALKYVKVTYCNKIEVNNSKFINFLITESTIEYFYDAFGTISNLNPFGKGKQVYMLEYDNDDKFIKSTKIDENQMFNIFMPLNANTKQVAFQFCNFKTEYGISENLNKIILYEYEANPHYKTLTAESKKESNQEFFRDSISGKITLWKKDYDFINKQSINDNLYFCIIKNHKFLIDSTFNKIDCKYDCFKKSVELKLSSHDRYKQVLDNYEKTYDLIKLAPKKSKITLTKRAVVQIYIKGENVISSYAGGTYWEDDVNEVITDENALLKKYYFAKGPTMYEYSNKDIGFSAVIQKSDVWKDSQGNTVKFIKVANKGQLVGDISLPGIGKYRIEASERRLYDDAYIKVADEQVEGDGYFYLFLDLYQIQITTKNNTYYSKNVYAKYDSDDFIIANQSSTAYPMTGDIYLGNGVIVNSIWGRLICDADSVNGTPLYDLPYDDFAINRANYKKCIGLNFTENKNSLVHFVYSADSSKDATSYGLNDFGTYFVMPYSFDNRNYYPVCKSAWANVSIWVYFGNDATGYDAFEKYLSKYYKEYTIKDVIHIADVISILLKKINPALKHEATSEYSNFLYSNSNKLASSNYLGACQLYITQKTNILKGEYDQAAQKSEITLKAILEMLRDSFRCYWFIDNENRLRIEHISYFLNGGSYDNTFNNIQLDLTNEKDKFNKQYLLYSQYELDYSKSELNSQYKFKWMDDSTDSMANLVVDFKNNYLLDTRNEEITISNFSADIDYMLFNPDSFSNDGYAIILADYNTKKVPIIKNTLLNNLWKNFKYTVYTQNWYMSWNNLIHHYSYDLPGNMISLNNIENLPVNGIKHILNHSIKIQIQNFTLDKYKLIKTKIGNGQIESVSTDVNTQASTISLSYD